MKKSDANLILEQLTGIKSDITGISTKLLEHDGKFDRIFGKLVEHDLRFSGLEEKMDEMATKEDVRMLQTGIDALAVKAERIDHEFAALTNK